MNLAFKTITVYCKNHFYKKLHNVKSIKPTKQVYPIKLQKSINIVITHAYKVKKHCYVKYNLKQVWKVKTRHYLIGLSFNFRS